MQPADPDCPFCRIVQGIDPDVREVYRDEQSVAFFPTEPAVLGHTLLIPRAHIPDIWRLDLDLAGHLGRITTLLSHAIKTAVRPDGLNVIQSNGEAATQTVAHLHIHVVPRWTEYALGRIWPLETSYSESQKDAAWEDLIEEVQRLVREME